MAVGAVSKGWKSPEGYLAVYLKDGRSGYYVPGRNVVVDGSGAVIESNISGIETPASGPQLNPLGPGLIAPATPSDTCWDGSVRAQGTCPPQPAAQGKCPPPVFGGIYRATNSANRYIFRANALHLIPDQETAVANGWTDWTDVDPSCFSNTPMGDPIPSVKGQAQQPAPKGDAKTQCAAAPATCPDGQKLGKDDKGCPACVADTGGIGDLFKNPAVLLGGAALLAVVAMGSGGRR